MKSNNVFLPYLANQDTDDEYPQYLGQDMLYVPFNYGKIVMDFLELVQFVNSTDFTIYLTMQTFAGHTLGGRTWYQGWFYLVGKAFKQFSNINAYIAAHWLCTFDEVYSGNAFNISLLKKLNDPVLIEKLTKKDFELKPQYITREQGSIYHYYKYGIETDFLPELQSILQFFIDINFLVMGQISGIFLVSFFLAQVSNCLSTYYFDLAEIESLN